MSIKNVVQKQHINVVKSVDNFIVLDAKVKSKFLLSHCRYLDLFFTEMFLEQSSTIHMNFVQIAEFDWLPWQHKG